MAHNTLGPTQDSSTERETVREEVVTPGEPTQEHVRDDTVRDTRPVAESRNAEPVPAARTVQQPVYPPPMGNPPQPGYQPQPGYIPAHAEMLVPGDRIRWGPVWAGLMTTLTGFIVLELLAYAIGILNGTSSTGTSTGGWVTGIIALIAFFLGGWVAEMTSAARGVGAGIINGLMVWALGVTLIVLFSLVGLGTFFGAAGNVLGQIAASSRSLNIGQLSAVSNLAAWGAFISLVASALAAALGGLVASRGDAIGRLSHNH